MDKKTLQAPETVSCLLSDVWPLVIALVGTQPALAQQASHRLSP